MSSTSPSLYASPTLLHPIFSQTSPKLMSLEFTLIRSFFMLKNCNCSSIANKHLRPAFHILCNLIVVHVSYLLPSLSPFLKLKHFYCSWSKLFFFPCQLLSILFSHSLYDLFYPTSNSTNLPFPLRFPECHSVEVLVWKRLWF